MSVHDCENIKPDIITEVLKYEFSFVNFARIELKCTHTYVNCACCNSVYRTDCIVGHMQPQLPAQKVANVTLALDNYQLANGKNKVLCQACGQALCMPCCQNFIARNVLGIQKGITYRPCQIVSKYRIPTQWLRMH